MSTQPNEVGLRHFKPKDLKWDDARQTWTAKLSLLGNTIECNGSDPERLCEVMNDTIGQHMKAHNLTRQSNG
jgi:hypothetical protein